MRGSHPGSFEVGHMARDGRTWDGEDTGESYDLIVVGAGISGLAAAWYYRRMAGNDARILLLDNHDDFGGHAKRNEFSINGETIIGYGGTMLIEAPAGYPAQAKKLLQDLGIQAETYDRYEDASLFSSHGLDRGLFLDEETFGADFLAVGDVTLPKTLDGSPLTEKARADLARLYRDEEHYLHDVPAEKRRSLLHEIDYLAYLRDYAGMAPQVLDIAQPSPRGVWAINADGYPAWYARYHGYPGFGDLKLDGDENLDWTEDSNFFHFPDGNATVARMLVRMLVPAVAPGDDMQDIVTARFHYNELDQPASKTRIRLSSTVVRARHENNDMSGQVVVTYVRDGKAHKVRAGNVVMACYNALVPRMCPEMPAEQRAALSNCIRAPLVYTNVLIRNWTSFEKLGISGVSSPGFYHHRMRLDFPVSIGDYEYSKSPDHPVVLHMTRVPGEAGNPSAKAQFQAGKRDLLQTPFETFERNTRDELNRILGDGGFDAARDIAGITVNRWPHGYAYTHDPETDSIAWEPDLWPERKRYWKHASRPFGNIRIAGTDAASNAMTEAAIEQAYRAIEEIG
jgi:spermidine dehydrogenase